MNLFLFHLLNGISLGSILFLLSSGLTIMFGVMGILNLAHGALYMIGAYMGWTVAVQCGLNIGLALLAAGTLSGLVGLVVERGFLRHLYKQLNDQVLLTFGFVYILTNLSLWVWGPRARVPLYAQEWTIETPPWRSASTCRVFPSLFSFLRLSLPAPQA